jgi:hypothetical protein
MAFVLMIGGTYALNQLANDPLADPSVLAYISPKVVGNDGIEA